MITIYIILHAASGRGYVGHTINFKGRKAGHLNALRAGRHQSTYLQNAWNKYGEAAFIFRIIEICDDEFKLEREQFWINVFGAFNLAPVAGSRLGVKHSDETRRRIGVSNKGKRCSPEKADKIRKTLTGRNFGFHPSEEVKRRIGNSLRGRKLPEATKVKISEANAGRKRSDETRLKMSKSAYQRYAREARARLRCYNWESLF